MTHTLTVSSSCSKNAVFHTLLHTQVARQIYTHVARFTPCPAHVAPACNSRFGFTLATSRSSLAMRCASCVLVAEYENEFLNVDQLIALCLTTCFQDPSRVRTLFLCLKCRGTEMTSLAQEVLSLNRKGHRGDTLHRVLS